MRILLTNDDGVHAQGLKLLEQIAKEDVTYSGTVAGAMEGAILGVPAIALSQAYGAQKISVTPLRLDLTDDEHRLRLEKAFAAR